MTKKKSCLDIRRKAAGEPDTWGFYALLDWEIGKDWITLKDRACKYYQLMELYIKRDGQTSKAGHRAYNKFVSLIGASSIALDQADPDDPLPRYILK
jgi:predicted phosphoadenosine phosphosulfate sulfurtransferase